MRRGGSIYDHPQYVEQYVAAVRPDVRTARSAKHSSSFDRATFPDQQSCLPEQVLCFDRYPSFGFQMSPPPETVMRPINDTCTHSTKPAPIPSKVWKENNTRQQSAAVQTMSRASSETLATATYTR